MRFRKTATALGTIVSLLSTPSCQNILEIRIQGLEGKNQLLLTKNQEMRQEILQLRNEAKEKSEKTQKGRDSYTSPFSMIEDYKSLHKQGDQISRFKHPDGRQDILLKINTLDYLDAKAIRRYFISEEDFIEPDNKYIKELIKKLDLPTDNKEKDAEKILEFVQNIPYLSDKDQYAKTVTETLAENSGDCEDLAILAVSILRSIAIPSTLVQFINPKPKPRLAHMGTAISGDFRGIYFIQNGISYFYAEQTDTKAKIGDFPKECSAYIPLIEGKLAIAGVID